MATVVYQCKAINIRELPHLWVPLGFIHTTVLLNLREFVCRNKAEMGQLK